jgi:hypothetical protein
MIRTGSHDDGVARARLAARSAARVTDRRATSRRLRGKLNLFQAMVVRWRELHPYVAVHMVGVVHPLEAARLKETIVARLEAAGLARIALDPGAKRFEFRPGPAVVELAVLPGGDDPEAIARAEIERQLNGPFPNEGTFTPFRFFAIDSGASFAFGIAYDHFVAGGDSVAVLLEELLAGYAPDASQAVPAWTPRRYPKTYAHLFLRDFGYSVRGLPRLRSLAASCRRSTRAPCRTDQPATNGFLSFRVDEKELAALVSTAKGWGVTVNDLLLALLLRALGGVVTRGNAGDRRDLGVASIVNLRREFESDAHDTFGLFLASLRISHPVPAGIELPRLAADVHAETQRIKTEKLYLQTLIALGWTAFAWRFLNTERRRRFLAKHYPIWAGMTSLNIDALWSERTASIAPIDYTRAVPTGPLAPLAFAITTFRGAMQIGVSFRIADVNAETALRVANGLLDQIRTL